MSKIEKILNSSLTKTVFATVAVSAIVAGLLVFPSLGYLVKYFQTDRKKLRRIFRRLEKQNLLAISESANGQIIIKISERGKQKALTYQIDKMQIIRPKNWDGYFRIVIFDIPEGQKKARDEFRKALKRLGFYQLQKSIFAHAFPCKSEVDFLKHNYQVANYVNYIKAARLDNQAVLHNYFQV